MQILLASQNKKKALELERSFPNSSVYSLNDVGLGDLEIVEDGQSFEANAELKVDGVLNGLKMQDRNHHIDLVLADDSGLCVDALQGSPGIYSARLAEQHPLLAQRISTLEMSDTTDRDALNNGVLLELLKNVSDRKAFFYCALCVGFTHSNERFFVSGRVDGAIGSMAKGVKGFGYDPLFVPNAFPELRMAELSAEQKDSISHRGHALQALKTLLKAQLGPLAPLD